MPKADNPEGGMDFTNLPLNPKWPAMKGEAPRLAGQFGRMVKVKTESGRLEARVVVRRKG